MTETLHPLAKTYLDRLERAADRLPGGRRRELIDDIEAHILESLSPDPSDAEVLTVLDRLGEPEDIVEAEAPPATPARDSRGNQEWAAIILLLLGGFAFGVGWIVGLIFLWGSKAWSTRDKLIGTLFWPGGLAAGTAVASTMIISSAEVCVQRSDGSDSCQGGDGSFVPLIALIAALLIPVLTAIYLARRARRHSR
jgi:hypothetical protein